MRRYLILLPLLLSACASQPPADLQLDARCPPELRQGQQFTLRLPANPSAGYQWQLLRKVDPVLQSLGAPQFIPPEQAGRVGTSGLLLWTFRAAAPGSTRLILNYRRPWDQGETSARKLSCDIQVKN